MGLIQVRKLVWETFGDRHKESNADSAYGQYRIWHPFGDDGFMWMLLNETNWQPVESLESAIAACQADFERRVLAEIEVAPLSFPDGHGWSECRNYYVNDNRFVYDGNGPALSGKALTREEAIDACNAHNRRLILGETEQ